ncbi:MAG: hypothetical protein CSA95_07770 [Bacteroidetes bacterium]|nr:MAG: hypothetical protein CSA95_07770 [Bacteroidota bacterium]PIE88713.1 MAG: hypothetical protein CSA04_00445 [Bacteroidota bacterium]
MGIKALVRKITPASSLPLFSYRRIGILILLLQVFSNSTAAQNRDATLEYARKLTRENEYEDAIAAYRRVLFFAPELTDSIAKEVGSVYCQTADYTQARYYYNIAYHHENQPEKKAALKFDIIQTHILEKAYLKAKLELANLRYANLPYARKTYTFYHAIVAYETEDYEEAYHRFLDYFGACDTAQVTTLFQQIEKYHHKNPNTAMWLSLIPGLGQAYVHEYREAINSFIINALFVSLYFYVSLTYNPLQGFVAVLPWFQRYYVGGIKRAKRLAQQKRKDQKELVLKKLLEYSLSLP